MYTCRHVTAKGVEYYMGFVTVYVCIALIRFKYVHVFES